MARKPQSWRKHLLASHAQHDVFLLIKLPRIEMSVQSWLEISKLEALRYFRPLGIVGMMV